MANITFPTNPPFGDVFRSENLSWKCVLVGPPAQWDLVETTLRSSPGIPSVSSLELQLEGKQPAGFYAPSTGISPSAITGTAVITTDARLSDARTPSAHEQSISTITGLADALAGKQAAGSYLQSGDASSLSVSRAQTAGEADNVNYLVGHRISELENDSGFITPYTSSELSVSFADTAESCNTANYANVAGYDINSRDLTTCLSDATAFAPAIAPSLFRFDATNGLQLFNPDTSTWHALAVRGQPGQQTLEISTAIP